MTVTAWRLVKTRYLPHAFDGEGARLCGGRWNSPGVTVVYLAESLALAALEVLVHIRSARPLTAYSAIPVRFDARLVRTLGEPELPADWHAAKPPIALHDIGDAWVAGGGSPVLSVPSAVVRSERIFVLNPAHPGFKRIRIGTAQPFALDDRLKPRRRRG